MKMKKAFTLSELLIALGVIAVLCAIVMPIVSNLMPNQNVIMAKRAYYTAQTVIADMINDEACYPDATAEDYEGFDDGRGYETCAAWDASKSDNAEEKFLAVFADKLGVEYKTSPSKRLYHKEGSEDVEGTKDGILWTVRSAPGVDMLLSLNVDVNGKEAPNCGQGTYADPSCTDGRTSGFDVFEIYVYKDGRLEIDSGSTWVHDAVKVNKNVTDE